MTYVDEVANIGTGNVAGKKSLVSGLSLACNFKFKPSRVQLRSTDTVRWIFDIGKFHCDKWQG